MSASAARWKTRADPVRNTARSSPRSVMASARTTLGVGIDESVARGEISRHVHDEIVERDHLVAVIEGTIDEVSQADETGAASNDALHREHP